MIVCPDFLNLISLVKLFKRTGVNIGSQDVFYQEEGAYTGEISPLAIKEIGCSYTLVGHSERRQYGFETDEIVNKKALIAVKNNLLPIICLGEKKEERQNNLTNKVLEKQLRGALNNWDFKNKFFIAYEPVWAIGTGEVISPEQAREAHIFIKQTLEKIAGSKGKNIPVLYGGSVDDVNTKNFVNIKEVDGLLVGGASLQVEKFMTICKTMGKIN
ncbi:MAG: triose-phosphate isomerase [Planctomycetes bacterium]|nr:triose-phosphate isomerase [Planctomycetota bacterium]